MPSIHSLANPARFMRLMAFLFPFLVFGACTTVVLGLYYGLYDSPRDYQQGEAVRIMYIHVPAAYLGIMIYGILGCCGFIYIVWRHPLAAMIAKASAPIGAVFTFVCLVTGSLWGKPMWGTWWVWDGRLTSVLILFFIYLGYLVLGQAFYRQERGRMATSILALVGLVNLPIIKYSVEWWNSLHQGDSLFRSGGPAMPWEMLLPLVLMMIGFTLIYLVLMIMRVKTEIILAKVRRLQLKGFA